MDMLRNSTAPHLPILVDDDRLAGGPLGRDAGLDSAHNRAAVAIIAVAGLAVVAGTLGWLSMRGSEPVWIDHPVLMTPGGSTVPADAPVLRPGFGTDDELTHSEIGTSHPALLTAAPLTDDTDGTLTR